MSTHPHPHAHTHTHTHIVATYALGHMMYGYTLLVPMNQKMVDKLYKEHNIGGHKWSTTYRVPKSQRSKMGVIYMQSWKHLYYAPCLARWALFGSLVPAICNRT